MASQAAVSAGTTATLAVSSGWSRFKLLNNSAVIVYYGYTSAVTTATGSPIAAGASISDTVPFVTSEAPAIYVVVATGTADCRVLIV